MNNQYLTDFNARIALVGKDRYLNDPVCNRWVHSRDSVEILIGWILERSDGYFAELLKNKSIKMPAYVFPLKDS